MTSFSNYCTNEPTQLFAVVICGLLLFAAVAGLYTSYQEKFKDIMLTEAGVMGVLYPLDIGITLPLIETLLRIVWEGLSNSV